MPKLPNFSENCSNSIENELNTSHFETMFTRYKSTCMGCTSSLMRLITQDYENVHALSDRMKAHFTLTIELVQSGVKCCFWSETVCASFHFYRWLYNNFRLSATVLVMFNLKHQKCGVASILK